MSGDFDPFAGGCVHLCVDMQRMFAEATPWHTPWMLPVLAPVEALAAHAPEATIFTRFVPPRRAEDAIGEWVRYYGRWADMTLERMPAGLVDLVPALARFVPPARVVDKAVYSPWHGTVLLCRQRYGSHVSAMRSDEIRDRWRPGVL